MEGEEKLCVKHCCRFWGQSCDEKFPASTELHSSMEYIFSGTKIFVFAAQIIPFPVYMFQEISKLVIKTLCIQRPEKKKWMVLRSISFRSQVSPKKSSMLQKKCTFLLNSLTNVLCTYNFSILNFARWKNMAKSWQISLSGFQENHFNSHTFFQTYCSIIDFNYVRFSHFYHI